MALKYIHSYSNCTSFITIETCKMALLMSLYASFSEKDFFPHLCVFTWKHIGFVYLGSYIKYDIDDTFNFLMCTFYCS